MDTLAKILQKAIAERVFPGCVLGLIHSEGTQTVEAFGTSQFEGPESFAVKPDTVYDLASVTKSIPVGTLTLKRVLEGALDLEQSVCEILPDFAPSHRKDAKVWHLLTHSLDYRFPMSSLKDLPAEQILQRLYTHTYAMPPGTLFNYGNACSVILGKVLEQIGCACLEDQAREAFFEPLGMTDSLWNPLGKIPIERIVPTEDCPWRGQVMRGVVHDESAYALQCMGAVGSAGMFSTVPDLLRFVRMLLQDGELDGRRVMPPGVLGLLQKNRLSHLEGQGTALGWELCNRRFMGSKASESAFGKTGFTGTCIICDPMQRKAMVLLSNFTWPKREPTVERIYEIRRTLADQFFG